MDGQHAERDKQKRYWESHTPSCPSVEAMMLDSKAATIDKMERPEVGCQCMHALNTLLATTSTCSSLSEEERKSLVSCLTLCPARLPAVVELATAGASLPHMYVGSDAVARTAQRGEQGPAPTHARPHRHSIINAHRPPPSQVLTTLGDVSGCRVLELGAGIGRFTGDLAQQAAHVTAVDFMEASIT